MVLVDLYPWYFAMIWKGFPLFEVILLFKGLPHDIKFKYNQYAPNKIWNIFVLVQTLFLNCPNFLSM